MSVDVWEHDGRLFEILMASNVVDDGMSLELTDLGDAESGPALEAFWHDGDARFDFIVHRKTAVPFVIVERFVAAARTRLPPTVES